jgi:hypothetical protein
MLRPCPRHGPTPARRFRDPPPSITRARPPRAWPPGGTAGRVVPGARQLDRRDALDRALEPGVAAGRLLAERAPTAPFGRIRNCSARPSPMPCPLPVTTTTSARPRIATRICPPGWESAQPSRRCRRSSKFHPISGHRDTGRPSRPGGVCPTVRGQTERIRKPLRRRRREIECARVVHS